MWLIGDGSERSNLLVVRTRIKDLLRIHSIDWRRAQPESLVCQAEQELRSRLEEAQNS